MMSGRLWRVLVGVALAVAAFNLRPAVASIGPLLGDIRAGLPMSPTVAGLLTSVPPACFAVIGTVAPRLVRRVGPATVVWMAMAALALGLAGRALAGAARCSSRPARPPSRVSGSATW
jgi:CP family cyanate transporter-like MFS transporter